jgi:hypothetical protein
MRHYDKEQRLYLDFQENANFIKAMMKRYMLCSGIWREDYNEIIGTEFHDIDIEWHDEYLKFDGDTFEIFIETIRGELVKEIFLYSDFLKWEEKRKNK